MREKTMSIFFCSCTSKQYLLMSSVVISPDSDFIPRNNECCRNSQLC